MTRKQNRDGKGADASPFITAWCCETGCDIDAGWVGIPPRGLAAISALPAAHRTPVGGWLD
jgi:hypothetical protein